MSDLLQKLKVETFCSPFLSLGLRRRGGQMSVDLSLFVILYTTNFINKLKVNDFLKLETKIIDWLYKFFKSTKPPHFPLRGQVGQISKRKRVLCWSIYSISLVYDYTVPWDTGIVQYMLYCTECWVVRVDLTVEQLLWAEKGERFAEPSLIFLPGIPIGTADH